MRSRPAINIQRENDGIAETNGYGKCMCDVLSNQEKSRYDSTHDQECEECYL
jgi:hypothetical protein